jgi:hypothetical protein
MNQGEHFPDHENHDSVHEYSFWFLVGLWTAVPQFTAHSPPLLFRLVSFSALLLSPGDCAGSATLCALETALSHQTSRTHFSKDGRAQIGQLQTQCRTTKSCDRPHCKQESLRHGSMAELPCTDRMSPLDAHFNLPPWNERVQAHSQQTSKRDAAFNECRR